MTRTLVINMYPTSFDSVALTVARRRRRLLPWRRQVEVHRRRGALEAYPLAPDFLRRALRGHVVSAVAAHVDSGGGGRGRRHGRSRRRTEGTPHGSHGAHAAGQQDEVFGGLDVVRGELLAEPGRPRRHPAPPALRVAPHVPEQRLRGAELLPALGARRRRRRERGRRRGGVERRRRRRRSSEGRDGVGHGDWREIESERGCMGLGAERSGVKSDERRGKGTGDVGSGLAAAVPVVVPLARPGDGAISYRRRGGS